MHINFVPLSHFKQTNWIELITLAPYLFIVATFKQTTWTELITLAPYLFIVATTLIGHWPERSALPDTAAINPSPNPLEILVTRTDPVVVGV